MNSMDSPIQIRPLCKDDDPIAISRIYALSWKAAYRGIIPDAYLNALREDRWAPFLKDAKDIRSLVMIKDTQFIGTASVCPAREPKMAGWGELVSIYLLPEYFGQGCGRLLLEAALAELERMDFKDIYLWVLRENHRARRFYEKNGFADSGETGSYEISGESIPELRYVCHCRQ